MSADCVTNHTACTCTVEIIERLTLKRSYSAGAGAERRRVRSAIGRAGDVRDDLSRAGSGPRRWWPRAPEGCARAPRYTRSWETLVPSDIHTEYSSAG
ncbi:hypothetical protein EVAR_46300_1 [Eumeta japonica]|uniref:Uncharacterized protein n=1 Tax=Eumeta variegata TaxID=151549 RepID=A0A4C1Y0T0_EUMVA|nr:hypothetical protein EVAR_46300_1 [Eumeta japonica]